MPSTQPEQSETAAEPAQPLDTQDNAARMAAVDGLLGIAGREAPPEKDSATTSKEAEQSVSESLAQAERPTDSGESQETVKPPKTLTELAELTGIKVEDLYAVEIPASEDGGESQTFGTLKDLAAGESDFAGRELQFEERRVQFGNDQAKARQELELILQSLPKGAIKPDVLDRARREREVMLDREGVRVLEVIPEWSSDDARRIDLAGIGEHMEQYGFEKNHLDRIADHRMLRYMRDNFKRMKLVEKALAGVKPVNEIPKAGISQHAKSAPKIQAGPDSTQDEKLNAIDSLLQ